MGAPSKRARKVRSNAEFDPVRLAAQLRPPRRGEGSGSWGLAEIFAARDLQMAGSFERPARLAEAMRTDDALFVAYENRLAPQRMLSVALRPANDGARARAICGEADALFGQRGVGIHSDTIADIHGCLVNHGVAFGVNALTPRADGSRVDFEHRMWPIDFVRWDTVDRCFKARVDPQGQRPVVGSGYQVATMAEEPIVHGDGRWVIYQKHEWAPWKQDAAILSASVLWARHAFALRDWAKGSTAHGNAKLVGELPEGMPLQDANGQLTPEAGAFLELLRTLASVDSPYGVRPAGSKTEVLANGSSAWQVWNELASNAERAAARVYLGTDGTLGSRGGAPGVDIESLFGVAVTRVEGDLRAIERGFNTGVIQPWAALNFGDSSLAPERLYLMPDGDEETRRKSATERTTAFGQHLATLAGAGFKVSQDYVDGLARDLGVRTPVLVQVPAETVPAGAETPTEG